MPSFFVLQAFSPVGRCKTFDASADGYGRGEGCAAIVMKLREGSQPSANSLAVLRSSATNQVDDFLPKARKNLPFSYH
jgi:acyl transferase domain-containing protein